MALRSWDGVELRLGPAVRCECVRMTFGRFLRNPTAHLSKFGLSGDGASPHRRLQLSKFTRLDLSST